MTTNNKLVRFKQQRIQSSVANSNSYSFFNLLTGPELLEKVEALLPESHRERQFPPTETLSMFLAQAMNEDRSCQKIVNDTAINRLAGGLSPCSTRTGGYCQAPEQWNWHGKPVYLVDGTTIALPDTTANQKNIRNRTCKKQV